MFSGKLKYLILFLVVLQSILLALMTTFFAGVHYQRSWRDYNKTSETVTIYLRNLSDQQSQDVFAYLSQQRDLSIWTKRSESSETGDGLSRMYIDLMGNPERFSDMIISGKTIVNQQQLAELLSKEDKTVTIGLDKGSSNMLYELPSLLFTTPLVLDRLDAVFEQTASINGSYSINGLENNARKEAFLTDLSALSGIPIDSLTEETFGSNTDYGIWPIVLAISIGVNSLVLLILFLICVLQSFKHFGTLILLGWDRRKIWSALFKPFLLFSVAFSPISALLVWALSGWTHFGMGSFIPVLGGASLSVLLLLATCSIPSLIVYLVSPLAAIHKRLPMRLLMSISLLFYSLAAALLIGVSHALDAPMDQFMNNIRVAKEWKNVEDMYVISNFVEGKDTGTYAGTSHSLESSMYRFYQQVSTLPGVYIASGEYQGQTYLDNVQTTYAHVPSKPFWYLTYSYNYLANIGIGLTDEDIRDIHNGVRLYLIPDSLAEQDLAAMKAYLQETVKVQSGDIETKFTKNPRFSFKTYTPDKSIFTWADTTENGVTSKDPILFVAAPENLYFMESANLFITGYNGILKVRDAETMTQVRTILEKEFPDLADNQLQFSTVRQYINGLQKDLSYTFYLFGGILVIIILTMMAIFWSFVFVYRLLYKEKLNVQYFMGFSPWRRYAGVLSLMSSFSIAELLISILIRSRLGIVFALISFVCQLFLLYFSLFRKEGASILQAFKE